MSPTATTLVHRSRSASRAHHRRSSSNPLCLKAPVLDHRSKSFALGSPTGNSSDSGYDSPTSPVPTLASIRILALAQLTEIEECLASVKASASRDVDDARSMVRKIREVCSRLPDIALDVGAVEELVQHHLPDWAWADVKAHLPSLPSLPTLDFDFELPHLDNIRARLPDWESVLPAMRAELNALDERLQALSLKGGNGLLRELLDRVSASDFFDDFRESAKEQEAMVLTTAGQIVRALHSSGQGARHISYDELPDLWKNNEFVQGGYRFIPLSKWKTLALSAFCLHNETLNIHTHFVPLVLSLVSCSILGPSADYVNMPDMIYTYFARVCLLTSAIWHCFAGCAHPGTMEFFARLDYVGIGWLISASISTVVYFSLSCHQTAANVYLSACLTSAVVGSFLPFMQWFNERKHKKWRLLYFVLLSLSGIAPCVHLALIHTSSAVFHFVSPIIPSLLAYGVGVVFYATHFPECLYPQNPRPRWAVFFDKVGLSSHALWHGFILVGIWLHRWALHRMGAGFEGELCDLW
ncbi:HlyIII-domain-containing protein [Exidia glandulosa HHB12029]|uniref:HlyIII-domain-containing protein n=1 Tax=Exidia glandulosa HHB12029 TaxID=1314781 RepID=A0A165JLR8_EXIGL|nr:HlyIII-domain-containing protein [Exidia glandulosa HHB12029]